jgi:hypothetical protein
MIVTSLHHCEGVHTPGVPGETGSTNAKELSLESDHQTSDVRPGPEVDQLAGPLAHPSLPLVRGRSAFAWPGALEPEH